MMPRGAMTLEQYQIWLSMNIKEKLGSFQVMIGIGTLLFLIVWDDAQLFNHMVILVACSIIHICTGVVPVITGRISPSCSNIASITLNVISALAAVLAIVLDSNLIEVGSHLDQCKTQMRRIIMVMFVLTLLQYIISIIVLALALAQICTAKSSTAASLDKPQSRAAAPLGEP